MIGVTAAVLLVGLGVVIVSPSYRLRIESILLGNLEGSRDKGSLAARQMLLKESIVLSLEHPLFGVGPGNFAVVNGTWAVAHNTYTELGAEAGIPALVLFLAILILAYRNLRRTRKLLRQQDDQELRILTGALTASLAAYVMGAFFADTAYQLFPYYLVAYTSAAYRIASQPNPKGRAESEKPNFPSFRERIHGQSEKSELARTR